MRSDPSMGSEPRNFECFASGEADIEDNYAKPTQLQDCLEDQGRS